MLERAHPALAVGRLIGDSHRQQPEHVRARANRHQVHRARRSPGVDANLARTGLRYRARHVEARRHPVRRLPHAPHPIAVRRVQRRGSAREGAHRLEDGPDARAFQGQLREALMDVMRHLDLRQLRLQPPLKLAALEDAGDLACDRAQEVDVACIELAQLGGLRVQHADQARARLDGHRQHRVEPVLVKAWHPLPVRVAAHVSHHRGRARLGDKAGDALPDLHLHLADHVFVQAVGGGQQQLAT